MFLALCFNIHSVGYFLSLVMGRSLVTCPDGQFVTSNVIWSWHHVPCLLVFALLYYSMMAAFLWWLMLTVGWFLAAGLKWSSEAIGNLAALFHIVSWVVPLVMTISLMAGQVVGADELSAVCFIVRDAFNPSFYALLIGVILPLMVFLVVGVVFLAIGLVGICRVRAFLRHKGKDRETVVLEKLIIRIGIFVGVYIAPATVVIGCFLYELQSRTSWGTVGCSNCTQANPNVFTVRIFMFLLIGILTGVWIWSKKTLHAWRDLFHHCCRCHQQQREEEHHMHSALDKEESYPYHVENNVIHLASIPASQLESHVMNLASIPAPQPGSVSTVTI